MARVDEAKRTGRRSFLARLRRDTGGNTLALMAIAMIPMAGFAGSAVDMARLYMVKARLQQACDAGVLAGKKFNPDSNSSTLDTNAITQARTFFANNFSSGYIGTPAYNKDTIPYPFTPSKTSDNQVYGTAQIAVPMTIMKMFGVGDQVISVSCQARLDIADTDIVFVLDTTGSMACTPAMSDADCTTYVNSQIKNNKIVAYSRPTDTSGADVTAGYTGSPGYSVPEMSGSRIGALRSAVLGFWDTMNSNKQATTNVRYGFVTYTSTVNAGAAIMAKSSGYMLGGSGASATSTYQSRKPNGDYNIGSPTVSTTNLTQTNCTAQTTRSPAQTYTNAAYNSSNGQATVTTRAWNSSNNQCTLSAQQVGPVWNWAAYPLDVTGYVAGNTVNDPTEVNGATTKWLGCVEERQTNSGQLDYSDYTAAWPSDTKGLPPDLDPDLIPSSDATRWRPMWPDAEYHRYANDSNGNTYIVSGSFNTNGDSSTSNGQYTFYGDNLNSTGYQQTGNVSCGKPIHRILSMSRAQVSAYVNATDFAPMGGTYHDTGMIWGTRLLSRDGIFSGDNQASQGRQKPNRVIVFLTDGDMSPSPSLYGMYGMEYWDKRVANGNVSTLKDYHNARFLAECSRAKSMGVDVWTVSIAPSATDEMQQCASTGSQALFSTSGSDLQDKFVAIAKQVAQLRLSQ